MSSANVAINGVRMSIDRDHDVGGLYHDDDLAARLDGEVIDRFIGDRGGDDLAVADINTHMRGSRTLFTSTTVPLIWFRALMRRPFGRPY